MTTSSLKAVLLSLALAASAPLLIATPVSAQNFGAADDFHDFTEDEPCMTGHRMRTFLAEKGYTDIKLNIPLGSYWQAKATRDGVTSLVIVDTCSARIINRGQI